MYKGSRKKRYFFGGPATERGEGVVRAWLLKKTFFEALKKSIVTGYGMVWYTPTMPGILFYCGWPT